MGDFSSSRGAFWAVFVAVGRHFPVPLNDGFNVDAVQFTTNWRAAKNWTPIDVCSVTRKSCQILPKTCHICRRFGPLFIRGAQGKVLKVTNFGPKSRPLVNLECSLTDMKSSNLVTLDF